MSMKSFFLQSLIIITGVILGLNLFYPRNSDEMKNFKKTLSIQTQTLENHLNKIESILSGQLISVPTTLDQSSNALRSQEEIDRSLRLSIERLSLLENRIGLLTSSKIPNIPAPPTMNFSRRIGPSKDPTLWFKNLSEIKQKRVEEIFRENKEFLSKNYSGGSPPDREKIKKVMEESEQMLRDKLKTVLDEKEYQAFLDSLPKPGNFDSNIKPRLQN